ncbi:MAG: hypothetical protein MJZ01_08610 [Bacteroidales bacterium]|nr:hypothetical protein [Bacteroidales bacterium]
MPFVNGMSFIVFLSFGVGSSLACFIFLLGHVFHLLAVRRRTEARRRNGFNEAMNVALSCLR